MLLFLLGALSVLSWGVAHLVVRNAGMLGLVDTPNERSSHSRPTPRGGGVGFVVATLIGALVAVGSGWLSPRASGLFIACGVFVAIIGLVDDRVSLSPAIRFICHLLASGIAIWQSSVVVTLAPWPASIAAVVAVFALVWTINFFNFMDGIDGLVASQAVLIGAAIWALSALSGDHRAGLLGALVAAGALGFLGVNAPPAKIFMGDVGSGFLGISLGVAAIVAAVERGLSIWVFAILFSTLFSDATVTLVCRIVGGHSLTEAHCTHLYQLLARSWGSHARVVLVYSAVNVVWTLPLAVWALYRPQHALGIFVVAVVPLMFASLALRAGQSSQRS